MHPLSSKEIKPASNAASRFGVSSSPLNGSSRSRLSELRHGLMCDARRTDCSETSVTAQDCQYWINPRLNLPCPILLFRISSFSVSDSPVYDRAIASKCTGYAAASMANLNNRAPERLVGVGLSAKMGAHKSTARQECDGNAVGHFRRHYFKSKVSVVNKCGIPMLALALVGKL